MVRLVKNINFFFTN